MPPDGSPTTVGLDLTKHVFQVHGVDASGRVIVAKALRRKDVLAFFAQLPVCLVGMEARRSGVTADIVSGQGLHKNRG
jgi:transposase